MSLIPADFAATVAEFDAEAGVSGPDWLRRLPTLVDECLRRWELEVDGPSMHGFTSLVLPVRRDEGPAVLKLTWPHPEAEHEHLTLRAWGGDGAVKLLAADPANWAMLLERLEPARDLTREPIDDACATIGELLKRLDRPALPQLERLSESAAELVPHDAEQLPRRFVDHAGGLVRELTQSDVDSRTVHTDLHYENVLRGRGGEWLAIDPKPLAAEPAFAVAPALWNRWDDAAKGNLRWNLRRRVDIICEAAGIDPDRARAWTVVREVDNAAWADSGPEGHDRVTIAIAIIKAMLD